MNTQTCFIEPLDVLFLRGNKLFGDVAGSHGESLVPPSPSVAAGAIRSRMLVDEDLDLAAFARGEIKHPLLGTPAQPGSFALTAFHLGRKHGDGRVEVLRELPADLQVAEQDGNPTLRMLRPVTPPMGILASNALPLLPVLAERERGKASAGYWIDERGWRSYIAGAVPAASDLVHVSSLWSIDYRLGVGLDADTRRAADGQLFTVQAVSMKKREHGAAFDVGFVASATQLPRGGTIRFGGDGRAAVLHETAPHITPAEPDYATIAAAGRARFVLTSPALFAEGWRPTGVDAAGWFRLHGVSGRLVCAAAPRHETVSGWNLAVHAPKPAQRAVPAGSVYWLEDLETTPAALRELVETGLWRTPCEDAARRAEGFNRIAIAAY